MASANKMEVEQLKQQAIYIYPVISVEYPSEIFKEESWNAFSELQMNLDSENDSYRWVCQDYCEEYSSMD